MNHLVFNTKQRGDAAEKAAAHILSTRGYHIIESNFKTPTCEIDLIAFDNDTLCFIEVRSTATHDFGGPFATISRHKQNQIIRGAMIYMNTLTQEYPIRFDVIGLWLDQHHQWQYELIQQAFLSSR